MTLDFSVTPAEFVAELRPAQRRVLDAAEEVAHRRRRGTLTKESLARLDEAQGDLELLRDAFIRGLDPRGLEGKYAPK